MRVLEYRGSHADPGPEMPGHGTPDGQAMNLLFPRRQRLDFRRGQRPVVDTHFVHFAEPVWLGHHIPETATRSSAN